MSIKSGVHVDAVLSGKAALDWKKDTLELKIVVRNVSSRYGLLKDLADLRIDDGGEEVPVWLTLTPFTAQQRLSLYEDGTPNANEEPQDAPTSTRQDAQESGHEAPDNNTMPDDTTNPSSPTHLEAPGEAHTRSEGKQSSDGTTPPPRTHTDATGVFSIQVPDYEETGLPLVSIHANVDMSQLAEMAYQGHLDPCVIELTRTVQRGTGSLSQTTLYHYQGPGHDPVIRRITTPMHKRWVESMREARTSAVGM